MARKLHIIMQLEMLAANKDVVEKSLKEYVDNKVSKINYIDVFRTEFMDIKKIPTPGHSKVKEAYWQGVEVEAEFDSLKNLLFFVMTYGPSSIEILEPKKMEIKMHEIQEIVGSMAEFMHSFAAQGAGGIVYSQK